MFLAVIQKLKYHFKMIKWKIVIIMNYVIKGAPIEVV